MSPHSPVQLFMEMASGLLLSEPLDVGSRARLIEVAEIAGLSERDMDDVVIDLMHRGIVCPAQSFFPAPVATQMASPSETLLSEPPLPPPLPTAEVPPTAPSPSPPTTLTVAAPHQRLQFPNEEAQGTLPNGVLDGLRPADAHAGGEVGNDVGVEGAKRGPTPLQRDMFKRYVGSAVRGRADAVGDPRLQAELLSQAGAFGIEPEVAGELLCRWLHLSELSLGAPAPPPLPGQHSEPSNAAPSNAAPSSPSRPATSEASSVPLAVSPVAPLPPPLPSTEDALQSNDTTWIEVSPSQQAPNQDQATQQVAPPSSPSTPAPSSTPMSAPAAVAPSPGPARTAPPPVAPAKPNAEANAKAEPKATPGESFQKYLRRAIPQLKRGRVSVRSETKLVEEGVAKLGLGEPYARELLRQVADELETPMLSRVTVEDDQRFEQFRERAAVILAEHRGINARSRMFLTAVGEELGLDEDELDQAIAGLAGMPTESLEEEKRASFAARLERMLSQMPDDFITAPIYDAILEDGIAYEGLSEMKAKDVLLAQAAQAKIAVIDRVQARRHIANLVQDGDHQRPELSAAREEARLWGLSDDEFAAVVNEVRADQAASRRRERRLIQAALAGSCIAMAALIAGVVWLLSPDDGMTNAAEQTTAGDRRSSANGAGVDSSGAGGTDGTDGSDSDTQGADGWEADPDFTIARAKLRQVASSAIKTRIEHSVSSVVAERRQAMMAIVDAYLQVERESQGRMETHTATLDAYAEYLRQWFRLEPNAETARAVVSTLLAALPSRGDAPPGLTPAAYESDVRRLQTLTDVIALRATPEERRQWLADELGDRLEMSVDLDWEWEKLESRCRREMVALLYDNLVAAVRSAPAPLEPYHWALDVHLQADLAPDEPGRVDRMQLRFLEAVLAAGKEPWEPYDALIRRIVDSEDAASVLRMLAVLEQTENVELQKMLSRQLLIRIGRAPQGQDRDEVVSLVRSAMAGAGGERADVPASERVMALRQAARRALSEGDATEMDATSQQIVALARLSTLAAISKSRLMDGSPFDSLNKASPPNLESAPATAPRAKDPHTAQLIQRNLEDLILMLGRGQQMHARLALFQKIAVMANGPRNVEPQPHHATIVAKYLVSPMGEEEFQRVQTLCRPLSNWPTITLALADQVRGFDAREPMVERLLNVLYGGVHVTLAKGDTWGAAAAAELLTLAARQLADPTEQRSTVGAAQLYLLEMYQIQTEAHGTLGEAKDVDDVLRYLCRLVADTLAGKVSNPEDRAWLERLGFLLTATEKGGLEEFVWLQRAWLQLLRIQWTARDGATAQQRESAIEIQRDLEQRDRAAKSRWEQVRDGEAALLKMWLLQLEEQG